MAVLELGREYLCAIFKAEMRLFGWQLQAWNRTIWGVISKAGMRLVGWYFQGCDEIIWVAVPRPGWGYSGGCFKVG